MAQKNRINRREFMGVALLGVAGGFKLKPPPNILWITSEDNSPLLGCYGDTYATTPNLDRFAKQGVVFQHAFANAPVCAPARFTMLTGTHASSMGTLHMRSRYPIPDYVKPYPELLRRAGYYCTNPGKTDYNFKTKDRKYWDKGSYKNRKPGAPFFHVQNIITTHESSIHQPKEPLKHDPEKAPLPPYHPDTPEIRRDWAQYYDKVERMDAQVGMILDQLEKDGLAEDTIVFYFSDHGGVLCRSKRFLYDTGTRVPMIIRFPKKYKHLAPRDPGVVSFADLAPTLLSLAGIPIPEYMEGKAFLGERKAERQEEVLLFRGRMDERYDLMRALRDKRFKYIRNYMPHRIYGQHLEYLWKAAATRSWEKEFKEGRCNEIQSRFWKTKPPEELYDTTQDPWEVMNLAVDPEYAVVLEERRRALRARLRELKDPGFIPEGEMLRRSEGTTPYELVRQKGFPMDRILETAELASFGKINEHLDRLSDPEPSVRYWAAVGCVVSVKKTKSAESQLVGLLKDPSKDVRIAAAEALAKMGRADLALPELLSQVKAEDFKVALHAINVLENLDQPVPEMTLSTKDKYLIRALSRLNDKLR